MERIIAVSFIALANPFRNKVNSFESEEE